MRHVRPLRRVREGQFDGFDGDVMTDARIVKTGAREWMIYRGDTCVFSVAFKTLRAAKRCLRRHPEWASERGESAASNAELARVSLLPGGGSEEPGTLRGSYTPEIGRMNLREGNPRERLSKEDLALNADLDDVEDELSSELDNRADELPS